MSDGLSRVLALCGLTGGLFSRALLGAPFGVHTAGIDGAGIFHAILRGSAWIGPDGGDAEHLRAGDIALFPRGTPHTVRDAPGRPTREIRTLPAVEPSGGLRCVTAGGPGGETEVLCGHFRVGRAGRDFVGSALPALVVARGASGPTTRFLDATLGLLEDEARVDRPGSEHVTSRLVEILFVQILRTWAAQRPAEVHGWLAAGRDPGLDRAIAAVLADPGSDWTVEAMARRAALGRSRFCERFHEVVGEPPARWLVRWRMTVARDALARGAGIAEVAGQTGYASEAAFSRAFHREVGTTPSRWRAGAG